MIQKVDQFLLRFPEPQDQESLYLMKNDPEMTGLLGGFRTGLSMADVLKWIEIHQQRTDEVVWTIATIESNRCIGHVGLYQIDFRIRSAEFAILIGDKSFWGRGLGRQFTLAVLDYGFRQLNMNRIALSALSTNTRALRLYRSIGFREEGILRQAQFKDGSYLDLVLMSILCSEYYEHN